MDTQLRRKRATTDSHAGKKVVKNHLFKDLKRTTHVSLYQQNLQSKKREV